MLYEMTGVVKVIGDIQTFASGFTKRELVITTDEERFPKDVAFAFTKDRCALLDTVTLGERLKITFGINGREYNGKYYVNLDGIKFEKIDVAGGEGDGDMPVDVGVPLASAADDEMPF